MKKKIPPLRKLKASPLPRNKQLEIGVYKKKHPYLSYSLIADQFHVEYDQVVYACLKYKAGKLTVCKPSSQKGKLRLARQIASEEEPDNVLALQFRFAISQLEADKDMNVADRVVLLDKLASIRKLIQQIELEGHIKRTDAGVIANIIRRFQPESTNDDVVKIYREELEKWKISAQRS